MILNMQMKSGISTLLLLSIYFSSLHIWTLNTSLFRIRISLQIIARRSSTFIFNCCSSSPSTLSLSFNRRMGLFIVFTVISNNKMFNPLIKEFKFK